MPYPQAYIDYLVHFHAMRDYFECHEILEEYWKEKDGGKRESVWIGLIQIAVSLYHKRRGNDEGAKKLLQKAIINVTHNANHIDQLGLSSKETVQLLNSLQYNWEHGIAYSSIQLPIIDNDLYALCTEKAKLLNETWGVSSNLNNKELIHRHLLRDRTEVLVAREIAIQQKEKKEN